MVNAFELGLSYMPVLVYTCWVFKSISLINKEDEIIRTDCLNYYNYVL